MRHAQRPTAVCIATSAFGMAACNALPAAAQSVGLQSRTYPSTHDIETFTTTGPNGDLIATGIFTMGIPYAASVVAATESTRPSDNYLYAPVAGPWLDLMNRGECPPSSACGNETAYKALLIANGVLQGVGFLQVVSGFIFPVTHSVTTVDSAVHVRIVPQVGREGYGLTAVGTF